MSDYLPPGEYLPHDEPMLLLDEVVNVTETPPSAESRYRPMARWPPFSMQKAISPAGLPWSLWRKPLASGQAGTATGRDKRVFP